MLWFNWTIGFQLSVPVLDCLRIVQVKSGIHYLQWVANHARNPTWYVISNAIGHPANNTLPTQNMCNAGLISVDRIWIATFGTHNTRMCQVVCKLISDNNVIISAAIQIWTVVDNLPTHDSKHHIPQHVCYIAPSIALNSQTRFWFRCVQSWSSRW